MFKLIKYLFGSKDKNYAIYLRGKKIAKTRSKEDSEYHIKELFKISENGLSSVNNHGISYNQRYKMFRSQFKITRSN